MGLDTKYSKYKDSNYKDIFSKLREINASQNLEPITPIETKETTDINDNIESIRIIPSILNPNPSLLNPNPNPDSNPLTSIPLPPSAILSISDSLASKDHTIDEISEHLKESEWVKVPDKPEPQKPQKLTKPEYLQPKSPKLKPIPKPIPKPLKLESLKPQPESSNLTDIHDGINLPQSNKSITLQVTPQGKPVPPMISSAVDEFTSQIQQPYQPLTEIPIPLKIEPLSTDLTQEEMDRLSMSLSEQSKEELVNTIRSLNITEVNIEIDSKCIKTITNIVNKCRDMNIDWFIAIAGGEGVGKSTLALNVFALICKLVGFNPIDTLLRTLIYDEDELLKFISTVDPKEKFLPLDLDEGANILFNRESMQVKRTYILKFFNVMRFLNAIVIIPTPNIKFIDKNVKAHRLKSIFYIPQRGVYWFYDKEQVDRMLASETTKKWYWVEPKTVGTFGVNKNLETITTLIKENYVRMFSEKVKLFIQSQESSFKHKSTTSL